MFTKLFGEKSKLIELYNAIKGTNYQLDTELEINTLEAILYMDRTNDISFLLDGKLIVLLEHQASVNKNMPLRFLLYIARLYEKLMDNKSIYRETQIKIPMPEFIVLYNGKKEQPEQQILKLSDAFLVPGNTLELEIKLVNINYGKSSDIMEKSKTLKDYSYFVYLVNQNRENGNLIEESIRLAIKDCLEKDILKEFLDSHGSEVINMLYTEFNLEEAKKVWQEEAREEGEKIGKKEGERIGKKEGERIGKKEGITMVAVSLLDLLEDCVIAEKTGLTLEEIKQLRKTQGTKFLP